MEPGTTKQINIMFTFDDEGKLIMDSRFLGVTFFDENGERSVIGGKPAVIGIPYNRMTDEQKNIFDALIVDYMRIKDQDPNHDPNDIS